MCHTKRFAEVSTKKHTNQQITHIYSTECVCGKTDTLKGESLCTLTQQPGLGTAGRLPEVGVDGHGACLKEKKKGRTKKKKRFQHQKHFKTNVKAHTKVSSL